MARKRFWRNVVRNEELLRLGVPVVYTSENEHTQHQWQVGDLGFRTRYTEDQVGPASVFVIKEVLSPSALLVSYPQREESGWVFFTHDEHDRVLSTDECHYMSPEKYAGLLARTERR